MNARRWSFLFAFGLAINIAGHVESAWAQSGSDRLLVTDRATGAVLFDGSAVEGAVPAAPELSPFFSPAAGVPAPPSAVILLEPAGEPPGEPVVAIPPALAALLGINPNQGASDLVLFGQGGVANVTLISDDVALQQALNSLPAGIPVHAVFETGGLDDLTGLLGTAPLGWQVQVQSVVPEPGTFGLLALGLGALGVATRRRL
jgi:hypothetical protein